MKQGFLTILRFNPLTEEGYGRDNKKFLLQGQHSSFNKNDSDTSPEKKEKNDTSPRGEDARLILLSQEVPMHLRVKEGPPRRIGGGIKYSTSYGASGRAFWRHDNAFFGGESVEARLTAGKRKNEAKLSLSLPDCLINKQTFLTSVAFSEDYTRAFTEKGATFTAGFSYDITPFLQVNYGLQQEISRIIRNHERQHSHLTSLPVIFEYDGTDSLLNPTKGWRIRGKTTPFVGRYGNTRSFWVHEAFMSTYIRPSKKMFEEEDNIFVLAPWLKMGGISSINRVDQIPPSKRLYSGGGNSVRAYGFQLLGPIDAKGTPIGGMSVLEFGGECRFALSEKIGAAVFAEAGSVGLKHTPKLRNQDLLWGAGVGLRYFTAVAPIRIDLAFPTKRRRYEGMSRNKKIDAPFQFYISVGQAF
ncbi:MAG: BamA/TamA family outer membrane protein [Chitinophagaceae bacterium]